MTVVTMVWVQEHVHWDIDFETGFGTLFTVKLKTPEHRTKSVSKTDVFGLPMESEHGRII